MHFGIPISDRTPVLEEFSRGMEIRKWLEQNEEPDLWAIVDDDSDMMPEQWEHFVQTSHTNGLTWQDFEKLCKILEVAL